MILLVHVWTKTKNRVPCDTFSRYHEPIVYLKWALAICETCQFITVQENITFQFDPFFKYCFTIVFVHISCSLKGCLLHDRNVHDIFSALNLAVVCIKPFTCNSTTFSLTQHAILSYIPYQMHSPSVTLWWVILIFMLFVLSSGNKVQANSL